MPVSAPPISGGTVLISEGRIVDVGKQVSVPASAQLIDAGGRTLTPGLIDAHSHVGLTEIGVGWEGADAHESGAPVSATNRVLDGINPRDNGFSDLVKGGVTCANVLPGSASVLCGVGAAVKCTGSVADEMLLLEPTCVKAALGEVPKARFGAKGRPPMTRMGIAAVLRDALYRAKEYAEKNEAKRRYDRDTSVLALVIRKQIPLAVHAHRADDIATAIRLARQFDIRLTIEHATEADLVLDMLKCCGASVAFTPVARQLMAPEAQRRGFEAPVRCAEHGIPFCLATDHPQSNGKYLSVLAALAVGWGMQYEQAIRAITLGAAEHVGISDWVGSIERGKHADLVLWSGDPLEFSTFADYTIIDGRVAYAREVCE